MIDDNQLDMFEEMYKKLPIMNSIKLGTFFSGIGSPEKSLGNIGVDFDLQFFSEVDKYAIKAYCAIHDESKDKCVGSITELKGIDLPYCDMWFGGFPCQDISLAGKGKGFSIETESRSSLGWEIIRLASEVKIKPKYIVFENVAAIFNETHRPVLNLFKQDLEELGYTLYNKLLNAKHYGVPQNRNRYFLVAILGEYNYNFPKSIPLNLRLKDMLEDEVDEKYYLSEKMLKYINSYDSNDKKNGKGTYQVSKERLVLNREIASVVSTRTGQNRADSSDYISKKLPDNFNVDGMDLTKIIQLNNPKHSNNRIYSSEGLAPTIKTMQTGGNQQPFIAIPEATKKGYAEAKIGDGVDIGYPESETRRGRVKDKISHTITTQSELGVVTNELRIRKLTPLECYRLLAFSDKDFYKAQEVISDAQLYKTAGNSIVVKVLEAIFKSLLLGENN